MRDTPALASGQFETDVPARLDRLVHLAGSPKPISRTTHAASGLPVMVHLNGLARMRLK
jgi:hypothetical protein